MTINLYI